MIRALNYDDLGSGKYDYMGMGKRIPIHAKKAEDFLKKGDDFNAGMHAGKCRDLCSTVGMIGSSFDRRAEAVLLSLQRRSQ